MISDPIADMLTRIRNAQARNLENVEMPYSEMKKSIAEVLKTSGYIKDFKVFKEEKGHKKLNLHLKDSRVESAITSIERISKPSNRTYIKSRDLKHNLGIYIISTSRGIVSSVEAKKRKLGGEIVCRVY